MDFDITDDMVEAAASAQYENTEGGRLQDAHPADQAMWREDARVGLEAAKFAIAAAAIRKMSHHYSSVPSRVVPSARDFMDRHATDYEAGVSSWPTATRP